MEIIDPRAYAGKLPATVQVRGVDGQVIDGAVAELTQLEDGTITAEIRIPGPQSQPEPLASMTGPDAETERGRSLPFAGF